MPGDGGGFTIYPKAHLNRSISSYHDQKTLISWRSKNSVATLLWNEITNSCMHMLLSWALMLWKALEKESRWLLEDVVIPLLKILKKINFKLEEEGISLKGNDKQLHAHATIMGSDVMLKHWKRILDDCYKR